MVISRVKLGARLLLEKKITKAYTQLLDKKYQTYHQWVTKKEEKEAADGNKQFPVQVVEYKDLLTLDVEALNQPIILLTESKKGLASFVLGEVTSIMAQNPQVLLAYGDEDEWNHEETVRMNPWYKPDFSLDTLFSYFYLGNAIAIRKEAIQNFLKQDLKTTKEALYDLVLLIVSAAEKEQIYHSQKIWYSSHAISYWGMGEDYQDVKKWYMERRPQTAEKGVSIIIPSKDNPQILERLLHSIEKFSGDYEREIIVVDNGSSKENQEKLLELQKQFSFQYLLEPMDFNFSAMCNLGAKAATKPNLLFLNDDCEVRQSRWLDLLWDQLRFLSTGAVGAKLYYPGGKQIQHCGIYGLQIGPVHKLQFLQDVRRYGDCRNQYVRNVSAVTAACLMVRKKTFRLVQGFDESLAVAFNDVDFCWRLLEAGFFNVVVNDVHLTHHESLSRGSDESPEKKQRLLEEKRKLQKKHVTLWGKDPYYHPEFTTGILDIRFSEKRDFEKSKVSTLSLQPWQNTQKAMREDPCLACSIEYAGEAENFFYEKCKQYQCGAKEYYFQGTAVVLGSDNSIYERILLAENTITGEYYSGTLPMRYRPDLVTNMPDQIHVELCGFGIKLDTKMLPTGTYQLKILARDRVSHAGIVRTLPYQITVS